jgi:hypothetical protein
MKKILPLFILILAIQVLGQKPIAGSKKLPPTSAAVKDITVKLAQFVGKEAGYTKFAENVWAIPFKGNSLTKFNVLVITIAGSELVIMTVEIAKSKKLRLSQELLYTILKYNSVADQVKAGIDDNGDLFLRAEVNGRLMDLKEFKTLLEQVAAASDQLHGRISSSLVSTP